MAYISDTARTVLEAAAERDDLSVLPFPESVKAKGGAMQKVLTGLRNRGFVRVVETDPQRVVITSEGMAAIGIADDEDDGPAEAKPGATTAETHDAVELGASDRTGVKTQASIGPVAIMFLVAIRTIFPLPRKCPTLLTIVSG